MDLIRPGSEGSPIISKTTLSTVHTLSMAAAQWAGAVDFYIASGAFPGAAAAHAGAAAHMAVVEAEAIDNWSGIL